MPHKACEASLVLYVAVWRVERPHYLHLPPPEPRRLGCRPARGSRSLVCSAAMRCLAAGSNSARHSWRLNRGWLRRRVTPGNGSAAGVREGVRAPVRKGGACGRFSGRPECPGSVVAGARRATRRGAGAAGSGVLWLVGLGMGLFLAVPGRAEWPLRAELLRADRPTELGRLTWAHVRPSARPRAEGIVPPSLRYCRSISTRRRTCVWCRVNGLR